MSISFLLFMFIIHWIADFVLQTHEQAINKSKDITYLCAHTGVYSITWVIALLMIGAGWMSLMFGLITFLVHTFQDFISSRIVKKFFEKGDTHNGFVIIGLDQVLHYVQLIFTFTIIFM